MNSTLNNNNIPPEINDNIFWRDGNFNECIGGFHFRTDLKQLIDKCKAQGLNPVGIKLDDEWGVEVIMERNKAYIEQYEKDKDKDK
jgi:hypothetical protein